MKTDKTTRRIVYIDKDRCNGCGQCVPSCAEGAIQLMDGKARLVSESYCDGLGACLGECPQDAIRIIEREADLFDPEAVEHHLTAQGIRHDARIPEPAGCPSSRMQTFNRPEQMKGEAEAREDSQSELSHWPVQIRLVPPTAPFLQGAHLLVAADCTPIAYGNFHRDFLKDRVVLIGCPKFDDARSYVEKFTDIFKTADIKSVTVVLMEVPCCQGLLMIVKKALELAGMEIPLDQITISTKGEIVKREALTSLG